VANVAQLYLTYRVFNEEKKKLDAKNGEMLELKANREEEQHQLQGRVHIIKHFLIVTVF